MVLGRMNFSLRKLTHQTKNLALLRKSLICALALVFCLGVLSGAYIHLSYWAHMPRTPDPANGRTFHLRVNHNTLVYVTRQERDRAEFVFGFGSYATIAAGLLLSFVNVYWDKPSGPLSSHRLVR